MQEASDEQAQDFLFKEYETANEVTFHADTFRDKLSAFFLSFAGAAVAFVLLILKGDWKVGKPNIVAGSFFMGVGLLGTVILLIHARLRRVQLENFAIICRIRAYFFGQRYELWNVVRLTPATLPEIKFTELKGSELWATSIIIPVAALIAGGFALIWGAIKWPTWNSVHLWHYCWYAAAVLFFVITILWFWWYKTLASYNVSSSTTKQIKRLDAIPKDEIDDWLGKYGLLKVGAIRGQNPTKKAVKARLGTLEHQVIGYKESKFRQFGADGQPLYGQDSRGPGGYGIMQLKSPPLPVQRIWDWTQNVDAGVAKYDDGKRQVVQHYRDLRAADPTLPDLTANQYKYAFYQYYDSGFYWIPDANGTGWVPDDSHRQYGDDAVKVEQLLSEGKLPPGWNDVT